MCVCVCVRACVRACVRVYVYSLSPLSYNHHDLIIYIIIYIPWEVNITYKQFALCNVNSLGGCSQYYRKLLTWGKQIDFTGMPAAILVGITPPYMLISVHLSQRCGPRAKWFVRVSRSKDRSLTLK